MEVQDRVLLDRESICKVIASTLSIPLIDVNSDLSYQSVSEWDSLGHVSLMLALEKKFHIKIDQDKILDLTSVDAIISHVLEANETKSSGTKHTHIEPKKTDQSIAIHRGLNNIYFDESKIALLDSEHSQLFYRGYLINDLVDNASYEQVAYLLLNGDLPNSQQLDNFKEYISANRALPQSIEEMIKILAPTQSLISVIRTAVSALSETVLQLPLLEQGMMYLAKVPTIIGSYFSSKDDVKREMSEKNLSQAEYLLYMLLGKIPAPDEVRRFEQNMILQAEHGSNPSTFAARVAKSTEVELGDALVSAIASFSGPLHGGALIGVMEMLEEIASPEHAKAYIQGRLKNKQPIFGFGHRVYRIKDPRSEPLRKNAEYLSQKHNNTCWLEIFEEIKQEMAGYIDHGINVNDDFHACICCLLLGFKRDMLVPSFLVARTAGWVAHIIEQSQHNILIRPRLKYTGHSERKMTGGVNTIKIQEIAFGSDLYESSKIFREKMLREPLGLALSVDDLQGEENQFHMAAVKSDNTLAGTLILKPITPEIAQIRQVAVGSEAYVNEAGKESILFAELILFAESVARSKKFKKLEATARIHVQNFYEKMGYTLVGEPYTGRAGTVVKMIKTLG